MTDAASMLLGTSAAMDEVRAIVRQAALSTEPVLLVGESGTGKELAAQTIHSLSARSAAPFVWTGCGTLAEALFEVELFGVVMSGGWTSATPLIKPGRIQQAEGGTLLLDDVGDLSAVSQDRVLRLIQKQEYSCMGAPETLTANVRVIAATNRSLPEMVKAGTFREDLYAALSGVQIALPPLRDRLGDLEVLVPHFLSKFARAHRHQNASVTPGATALLGAKRWLGNLCELENFLLFLSAKAPPGDIVIDEATVARGRAPGAPTVRPTRDARIEAERQAVEEAMRKAGGDLAVAARILGFSRRTLHNKLEELGLTPAD